MQIELEFKKMYLKNYTMVGFYINTIRVVVKGGGGAMGDQPHPPGPLKSIDFRFFRPQRLPPSPWNKKNVIPFLDKFLATPLNTMKTTFHFEF